LFGIGQPGCGCGCSCCRSTVAPGKPPIVWEPGSHPEATVQLKHSLIAEQIQGR
jgi:hypothetical protein